MSSEESGFITVFLIEKGNPSGKELLLSFLECHQQLIDKVPEDIVGDECCGSKSNVMKNKALGVKRVAFGKPVGLSLHDMGVKKKTLSKLRDFRAGVEGNISELKHVFGESKAAWKGLGGFKAYVWSSVISYSLTRLSRLNSGWHSQLFMGVLKTAEKRYPQDNARVEIAELHKGMHFRDGFNTKYKQQPPAKLVKLFERGVFLKKILFLGGR